MNLDYFPSEILCSILKFLSHQPNRPFPFNSKNEAIFRLAQTNKRFRSLVIQHSDLFNSLHIVKPRLFSLPQQSTPFPHSILSQISFLCLDVDSILLDGDYYDGIEIPYCDNLISLMLRYVSGDEIHNLSHEEFSRLKLEKGEESSGSIPVFLSQLGKFKNLRTLDIVNFAPCDKFSWTELITLLESLNLETLLFGVGCIVEEAPDEVDFERLVSAIDSRSRLTYLKLKNSDYSEDMDEFFESLLLALEPKSRLKVCFFTESERVEYFEPLFKKLDFGEFLINGKRERQPSAESNIGVLPHTDQLVIETNSNWDWREAFEILESHKHDASLQSLTCDISATELIPALYKILQNCKRLTSLTLDLSIIDLSNLYSSSDSDCDGLVDEEFATYEPAVKLVQSLFDEIKSSKSIRSLKVTHVSIRFVKYYLSNVVQGNTSIEELSFVQPRFSEQGLLERLPILMKSIRKNAASRIRSITCDSIQWRTHEPIHYRFEVRDRKLFVYTHEEHVIHFIGNVVKHWNKGDFLIDRVVLDKAPNSILTEIGMYEYMIFTTVTLGVVDREYCMIYNGKR